jgi:hypothetical protein
MSVGMGEFLYPFIQKHGMEFADRVCKKYSEVTIHKMTGNCTGQSRWSRMANALDDERVRGIFTPLFKVPSDPLACRVLSDVAKVESLEKYHDGFVYFLYSATFNLMKIGKTKDPSSRFKSYKTECPEELVKIAIVRCNMRMEKWLHSELRDYWHHGEWFSVTDTFKGALYNCMSNPSSSYMPSETFAHPLGDLIKHAYRKPKLYEVLRMAREDEPGNVPWDTSEIRRLAAGNMASV